MRISVIIPTLNEQESIGGAVTSAWGAGADQVIVADGKSQDETCRIALEHDCQVVESPAGRGRQLNAGSELATGDVLLFLHADCRLAANACDQIRETLDESFVFGGFRQSILDKRRIYRWIESGNLIRAKWRKMLYGDQGIFVRRETFEHVGKFPDYPIMEDVALSDRLKKLSKPVLLPGPIEISARRWQSKGVIRQTVVNWILFARYRLGTSPEKLAAIYMARRQS